MLAPSHPVQRCLRIYSSSLNWWETSKEKEQSRSKQNRGREEELLLWIKDARWENHSTEMQRGSLQQEIWLCWYTWTTEGRRSCRHRVSEAWHILLLLLNISSQVTWNLRLEKILASLSSCLVLTADNCRKADKTFNSAHDMRTPPSISFHPKQTWHRVLQVWKSTWVQITTLNIHEPEIHQELLHAHF